jgi:hypothetical protein
MSAASTPTRPSSRRPRISILLVLVGAAAVAVASVLVDPGGDNGNSPQLQLLASAEGKMKMSNTKRNKAVLRARNLVPGQTVRARVAIGVIGTDAQLQLRARRRTGTPGPYGGELARVLQVRLDRARAKKAKRRKAFYNGTLAKMRRLNLGRLQPGRKRRFKVSVTFPDSGLPPSPTTGDNVFQGSSAKVDLVWYAVATGG